MEEKKERRVIWINNKKGNNGNQNNQSNENAGILSQNKETQVVKERKKFVFNKEKPKTKLEFSLLTEEVKKLEEKIRSTEEEDKQKQKITHSLQEMVEKVFTGKIFTQKIFNLHVEKVQQTLFKKKARNFAFTDLH